MSFSAQYIEPAWIAGFMSGTSIDAVDAALILTDGVDIIEHGATCERKYLASERDILQRATQAARQWNWQGDPPQTIFDEARAVVTQSHHQAWLQLLAEWRGPRPSLAGVHGQTVLHRPPSPTQRGATLQLIDAPALCTAFGIALACDFRSDDIAAGGQGAPLAPVYHGALLAQVEAGASAALNLGGVANITLRTADGMLTAFDTGPANGPIDEWVEAHGRGTHDFDGRFAQQGRVDEVRLAALLDNPWFRKQPPKSLDRFDFNMTMANGLSFHDGCATLTAFTARAAALSLSVLPERPAFIVACGGGRRNPTLMTMLRQALAGVRLLSAEEAGWRGDAIEAEAFAYLAARRQRSFPISFPTTTGVAAPMTGGLMYYPWHSLP